MSVAYKRQVGIGIALLSVSLMTTEIILTRIFSVIVWYHFAFFAISVALFGTGAAAVLVHIRQHRMPSERTGQLLYSWGVALSFSIVAVDLVLVNVTPNWFVGTFTNVTPKLLLIFALTAAPFFFGGMALSLAMTRYSSHVHRLYFWDLVGAGGGCLAVIPLLSWLGGPQALLASALLATASALVFLSSAGKPARRRIGVFAAVSLASVLLLASLNPWLRWLDVSVAKGWDLRIFRPEFNRWNSFSMVTVFPENPASPFRGWGLSPSYKGPIPLQKTLVIDMNALTPITRFDGSFEKVRHAFFDLSALVYRLRPKPGRVCVIGAGGGRDVLAALVAGSKHVTGVEINPLIVEEVMKNKYRRYSGGLYYRDDVSIHVEDGRSYLRGTPERFDVVLLSMVDTSAATAAGAYALTENGLYTSDAFRDFMGRLRPGGVLSVSTVSLEGLYVGARLAAVARKALLSMGSEPARSVIVVQTDWVDGVGVLHDFLIKPDGFSAAEIRDLEAVIDRLQFRPAYLPGGKVPRRNREHGWMTKILTSKDEAALAHTMESWPVDVSAVDDNRPFFFYQNRSRDIGPALFSGTGSHLFGNGLVILVKVALVALVMVCAFLLAPLLFARRELGEGEGAVAWDLGYVACLGLGFMFIEIALIQRFMLYIGDPTYTLSVVLFVLLTCGGIGSRGFGFLIQKHSPRSLLLVVFAALIVYALVLGAGIDALSAATLSWSPLGRAALAGALIAPSGLLLGIPFPTGLSAVARRANTRIPWLWSTNSATSVLGSILATMTSLHTGIPKLLVLGATLYGCAAVLWLKVRPHPEG